jgi:hypothetical protein
MDDDDPGAADIDDDDIGDDEEPDGAAPGVDGAAEPADDPDDPHADRARPAIRMAEIPLTRSEFRFTFITQTTSHPGPSRACAAERRVPAVGST